MNFRKIKKMLSLYLESEFNYNKKSLNLETYLKNQEYKYDSDYISNEEWQETSFSIYKNNYTYKINFPNKFFNFCVIEIKEKNNNQISITLPYNNKNKNVFFKIEISNNKQKDELDSNLCKVFEISFEDLKKYTYNINKYLERIEIEKLISDKTMPDISILLRENSYLLTELNSFISLNANKDNYNIIQALKDKKTLKINKK